MLKSLIRTLDHPMFQTLPKEEFELGKALIMRMVEAEGEVMATEEENLALMKIMTLLEMTLRANGAPMDGKVGDAQADEGFNELMSGEYDDNEFLRNFAKEKVTENYLEREEYEKLAELNKNKTI